MYLINEKKKIITFILYIRNLKIKQQNIFVEHFGDWCLKLISPYPLSLYRFYIVEAPNETIQITIFLNIMRLINENYKSFQQ